MKRFLLICAALFCLSGFSQDFLDENYYLVDSLDQDEITKRDRELLDSVLVLYHATGDPIEKLDVLNYLSEEINDDKIWPKFNQKRLEFCYFRMFSRALTETNRKSFKRSFAEGINGLGQDAMARGDLMKSLDYFFLSLNLFEDVGAAEDYAWVYSNLGANYFNQGDIEKAEEYLQLCYDSVQYTNNDKLLALALNDLAVIHQEKNDLETSLNYHLQSLELSLEKKNFLGTAISYNNIGAIYCESFKDSLNQGVLYLNKAIDLFRELNIDGWTAMTYDKLALTMLQSSEYELAEKNANLALEFALQSGQSQPVLRAYRTLYRVKKAIGKANQALNYHERFVIIKDSVYNSNLKLKSAQKELEYQYKSEQRIAEKVYEQQLLVNEVENKKQKVIIYAITALFILIAIFVLILWNRLKTLKLQKEKIELQSEERKVLLKEIHHRVKNNFQIICSVLRLQAIDENNPVVDSAFQDAVNRIQSMAEVHELIYKEESFSQIKPKDYFEKLTGSIQHLSFDRKINYKINSDFENLPIEVMISLGISVNELITNSIKHAFKNSEVQPEISISLNAVNTQGILKYTDNGVGYDAETIQESFGTELIKTIIEQINGELNYKTMEKGSEVIISFRLNN